MTDLSSPLPSRRAQREAREMMATPTFTPTPPTFTPAPVRDSTELPSRRARRQQQQGFSPSSTPDFPANGGQWVGPSTGVGQSNTTVATLHVEQFPTGEIAGPIDHTGEIILTGPLTIPAAPADAPLVHTIVANLDVESPGIPRRATEALSIIGRAAPINENTKIPSVGQGISAGFATFFGLLVLALVGIAFFTDLI
jgi:hypothetical protein